MPYLAFQDHAKSKKATVMNYNGTSWGTVVKSGFSASQADDVTLALDSSNKPYVAYKDYGNGNKATVMTTGAAPLHDIDVQGKDSSITNGSTTPGDINDTDFGPADVASGATVDHTFTIYNPGSEVLTLSDTPPVAISGPNAAEFSVTTQPTSPVASGGNTTFTVHFAPVTCGVRSATISITTNVPGKNPFTFAIQGKGTATGANYVDQNCPPPETRMMGRAGRRRGSISRRCWRARPARAPSTWRKGPTSPPPEPTGRRPSNL
ncbi:MAG: hypothetical protein AUJ92_20630 [Armatimonadetes bacterium CG2_30_59_28]|nr:MAG: hypothetical protein AUJ92_20630 [Armatimonadetes bacterium CG2_30_59_28]